MIIDCPQCGFTGRVPDHATSSSRRARCPKCLCRFAVVGADGSARAAPDPEDSSYELAPIVADDPEVDSWYGDPDEPRLPLAERRLAVRPPRRGVRIPRLATLRIRMFQAWAVFFLIWAATIAARTAAAAFRLDDARFFSNDLLRPVAAVVVLVCASALICLSNDLSRRLQRLTYGPPPPPSRPPAADSDSPNRAA